MISNHSEGTFGRLRYLLGGDRPSQTAHLTLSPGLLRRGLEFQYSKGSIPTTPPHTLACMILWLLPILYILHQNSISSYSKAPWGLSVLSRVTCIFTGTKISPSLSLRQCPNRCAFRAGRNLPDKEFRYLRTVIVTAAVYWGFDQELLFRLHHQLTFQHRAGITPYTSTFVFAECCVFNKQLQPAGIFDRFNLRPRGTTIYAGAPSPEVTVLFCLVPSPEFSQAPEYSLPDHLCRFSVRFR